MEQCFKADWILKKKCICTSFIKKDHILNCRHVKREFNNETEALRKELWNVSLSLFSMTEAGKSFGNNKIEGLKI